MIQHLCVVRGQKSTVPHVELFFFQNSVKRDKLGSLATLNFSFKEIFRNSFVSVKGIHVVKRMLH